VVPASYPIEKFIPWLEKRLINTLFDQSPQEQKAIRIQFAGKNNQPIDKYSTQTRQRWHPVISPLTASEGIEGAQPRTATRPHPGQLPASKAKALASPIKEPPNK
jgi:hypothetical protein